MNLYNQWTEATGNLKAGVQHAFKDVLELAADEKINLVWGTDYSNDGGACLVNQAGAMLTTGGGKGVPSEKYGEVVSLFDQINRDLRDHKVNKDHTVSPTAAEILLRYFAPLKELNTDIPVGEGTYVEPTDEEMFSSWLNTIQNVDPIEEPSPNETPVKREG